ncbi:hypothetical protein [Streptomyces sp. NPDC058579]|uniref:hypothetical protein n=1 Tax=Streptomyces sp. NPDC058579 TaxID=3346548 RepID=UPI0036536A95
MADPPRGHHHAWNGPVAQGPPDATSATGTDSQWQATGYLIAEIAADMRKFEDEKRKREDAAVRAQRAITNARARLAGVVTSAGRSREWVRKTVG